MSRNRGRAWIRASFNINSIIVRWYWCFVAKFLNRRGNKLDERVLNIAYGRYPSDFEEVFTGDETSAILEHYSYMLDHRGME